MKNTPYTAVVVAAAGHGGEIDGRPVPLACVAGLSVVARTINAVRQQGAGALRLVLDEGGRHAEGIIEEARAAWKDSGPLQTVYLPPGASECQALRRAADGTSGDLLIAFADLAMDPGAVEDVLAGRRASPGEAAITYGEITSDFNLLAIVPAKLVENFPEEGSLGDGLLALRAAEKAVSLSAGGKFALRLGAPGDVRRAARLQVRALRRDTDGIVSRFLNRPVSLFLSLHFFSKMPFSPNAITLFAAAIGWVGIALVFWWAGYWWTLAGAFLFHVSSVLDGCDGEVARLRFQFSRFGEWFDNVLDEINNTLFIAAIGLGVWRAGGSEYYLWAAIFHVIAVATVDSATFYQLIRYRGGRGKIDFMRWFFQRDPVAAAAPKKSNLVMQFVRRDFYILMLLVFALADALQYGFWITIVADAVLFPIGSVQWFWQTSAAGRAKLSGGRDH